MCASALCNMLHAEPPVTRTRSLLKNKVEYYHNIGMPNIQETKWHWISNSRNNTDVTEQSPSTNKWHIGSMYKINKYKSVGACEEIKDLQMKNMSFHSINGQTDGC